jgi:hypothetical protein
MAGFEDAIDALAQSVADVEQATDARLLYYHYLHGNFTAISTKCIQKHSPSACEQSETSQTCFALRFER